MRIIKLSKRLSVLVKWIDENAFVADVGTDHGHIPAYLAQNRLAGRIIASDISAASLEAARRTATAAGVTNSISFHVTPGLDNMANAGLDHIIIAGMGGETIISILKNASWVSKSNIKLILQPQSKVDLLFKFLYDNDYIIKKTISVFDKKKQYIVALIYGISC